MPSTQPGSGLVLTAVRLHDRLRWAIGLFHKTTGLTAVTNPVTFPAEPALPPALSPPVHPRCARRLRSVREAPCRKEWLRHVRSSRRSPSVHNHTCALGLRCACVPIHFDGHLVGVAKLVVGPETPDRTFAAATSVLTLIVSGICQDSLVSLLSEEVGTLRQRVAEFREIHSADAAALSRSAPDVVIPGPGAAQGGSSTLVASALSHLHRHYKAPALSLGTVAMALGCNPRYLTTRFTPLVGERMHTYLVRLRVAHACRLLMDTAMPVKEIAYASGFPEGGGLDRAFRRHVGVSPSGYRRIFAAR